MLNKKTPTLISATPNISRNSGNTAKKLFMIVSSFLKWKIVDEIIAYFFIRFISER